jgi:hypothetical protein
MIPGTVSKTSEKNLFALATTIAPQTDVIRVTDTTSTTVVTTIRPAFGGVHGQFLVLINVSGANITTLTTGNIATAVTIGQNVATLLVFSPSAGKWYPGALA